MLLLILYYYSVLIIIATQVAGFDTSVLPLSGTQNEEYNIFFNTTHCIISNVPSDVPTPYFSKKNLISNDFCDLNKGDRITTTVPEYIVAEWDLHISENETRSIQQTCFIKNLNCYFEITFLIKTPTREGKAFVAKAVTVTPNNEHDSNLYLYVGVGVGVVVLVVLIQAGCIVSYSRKVANTRRALQNVLQSREEKKEARDRYSVGPVSKKITTTTASNEDDNIYASLEHLATTKDNGDTIKSQSIKNRPPLPLPHEMPSSSRAGDGDTWKSRRIIKAPMPLPHEVPISKYNVRTLPHKSTTSSPDRFPEPPVKTVMTAPRVRTKMQQGFPVTQPLQSTSQQALGERLPEPPVNAIKASPRPAPKVAPKKPAPSNVLSELNKVLAQKQNPSGSQSDPSPHTSKSSLIHAASTASVPRQTATNTSMFNDVPPPHFDPELNVPEEGNSSDEEWTYEKLQPVKKYLH